MRTHILDKGNIFLRNPGVYSQWGTSRTLEEISLVAQEVIEEDTCKKVFQLLGNLDIPVIQFDPDLIVITPIPSLDFGIPPLDKPLENI